MLVDCTRGVRLAPYSSLVSNTKAACHHRTIITTQPVLVNLLGPEKVEVYSARCEMHAAGSGCRSNSSTHPRGRSTGT